MRKQFYLLSLSVLALVGLVGYWHPIVLWWYVALVPLVLIGPPFARGVPFYPQLGFECSSCH